jgi:SsrA-binding protein
MNSLIATNRKALRDYYVLESLECGIELKGCEVKSLRAGRLTLDEGFARVENDGVILYGAHISPYAQASYLNVEPARARRLLLHKGQMRKIALRLAQKGLTLIPLRAYFNQRGFAKIELALCKGKRLYDRREDIKRRELDREIRRITKGRKK